MCERRVWPDGKRLRAAGLIGAARLRKGRIRGGQHLFAGRLQRAELQRLPSCAATAPMAPFWSIAVSDGARANACRAEVS